MSYFEDELWAAWGSSRANEFFVHLNGEDRIKFIRQIMSEYCLYCGRAKSGEKHFMNEDCCPWCAPWWHCLDKP